MIVSALTSTQITVTYTVPRLNESLDTKDKGFWMKYVQPHMNCTFNSFECLSQKILTDWTFKVSHNDLNHLSPPDLTHSDLRSFI